MFQGGGDLKTLTEVSSLRLYKIDVAGQQFFFPKNADVMNSSMPDEHVSPSAVHEITCHLRPSRSEYWQ